MKQKAKSLLALILALSLCLSMVCVPAYASDTDNIAVDEGATVIMAEETADDAGEAEEAEADTPAVEAEAETPVEEAAEELEVDASADEAEEEPEADTPADEADDLVAAAEGEDEEAADDTSGSATALTSEGGALSSGSYILEADVVLETSLTIAEGETVTLDLNGYTLTGTGAASVITVSGTFMLTDTSTAGSGVVTGGSYTDGGGVYVTSGASFTMDGGAISGNSATSAGGGVYLEDSASFTMNDGEISNNYTVENSSGGGVCLYTNATFVMNGGKITNNTCNYTAIRSGSGGGGVYLYSGCTFIMNDGEISNNVCSGGSTCNYGGGVFLNGNTTFTMYGGKITGNSTDANYGGGIGGYFGTTSTATVNIYGGEISGNSSGKYGGGIGVAASKVTLNISGGTISGNTAGTSGGGIYLYSSANNIVNLSGGAITGNSAGTYGGGIFMNGNNTVTVSGDPVVTGNTVGEAENNVYLKTATLYLTLGELTEGASIGVTTLKAPTDSTTVQFTTAETETTYYASSAGYFSSDAGYYVAADAENGCLVLTTEAPEEPEPAVDYVAKNVTTSTSYETLQAAIDEADSGDEIALLTDLTEDVTVASGDVITLDLAGCTLTGTGTSSVITVSGTLTLEDSSEDGTGKVTGGSATYGGGVYVNGATFTMESGTITGNTATTCGGGVCVYGKSTFTMNGGTITNNTASNASGSSGKGGGVALRPEKTTKTYGATFTMNGGTISDNTSAYYGGGVSGYYGYTTMTINGGKITGNSAKYGGGIEVNAGSASSSHSSLTITGGEISGNTATNGNGGGIYCTASYATLSIEGGTITGNTASGNGGGVSAETSSDLTMSGGTISNNTADNSGGGVYVTNGSTFTMSDGTISDNTASSASYYGGGGVLLYASGTSYPTFTMTGGTITGNTSGCYGGGISSFYGLNAITITGGNVANNSADMAGDDLYANASSSKYATLTLSISPTGTLACGHDIDGWYEDAADARWSETNAVAVDTSEALTSASAAIALKAAHGATEPDVDYVAQNVTTSTSYETLQAAIDAASSGDEITLLMDLTEDVTVASDDVITLDLAGYTLTGSGTSSVITVSGSLTLKDSSEDGTGKVTGGSATYGGGVYVSEGAAFTLSSGAISGNTASFGGGGVYVAGNASFTMDGGTISGNEATGYYGGGGVLLWTSSTTTSATFTMNGGTISDNTSANGGGGVCSFYGANIITINGGTISNNTAAASSGTGYGGGVYLANYGTLNLTAGTISGNSTKFGGGIYIAGVNCTLNLSGGSVTGNNATSKGGGIYVYTNSSNAPTTNVSGGLVVTGNTAGADEDTTVNNLYLTSSNAYITLGELTEGASIGVTTSTEPTDDAAVQFTTTETDTTYYITSAGYFTSDAGYEVQVNDAGYLELATVTYVAENVTTTTYYTTLQDAIDAASDGDELTILMDLEENVSIESKSLTLDLAGYTLTTSTGSTSTVTVGGTSADAAASLTLKDSSEEGTGTLAGTGSSCSYGVLRINTTSTVVMESGTITGGLSMSMGGGVYVGKSASFTMNGGAITGNRGNMGGGVYVYTDGEFILNDGSITGNSTYYTTTGTRGGGGVYLADSSIFTMNGGTISGNTCALEGGGVYVYSVSAQTENSAFIMNGGTITGNTSTGYGGGVYIGASNSTYVASFTMTGGTISNNTSGSYGGGVATYTGAITIDITGGTISGNSATGYGGGIYAANRTTVSVANCEVTGNTGTYGGGVYVYTSLTMTGCTVTGNTGTRGGGLYLYTGCPATVSDSSIANNTATAAGDDIYANASSSKPLSLTLSGTPSGTLTACGHDIDGWYSDASGSRWAEDNAVAVDTSETLTNTSALALKAAHGAAEVEFAIVTHPEDVTAEKGSTATFTVVATGTDLTYQWQYQTATGSKWYNCTTTTGEGYASDSVTLTANAGRDGYKYRCVVTNGDGETLTSDAATLTVTTPVVVDPITVTTQPADVTAEKGSSATFTVEAVSNLNETLTYQWQYKTASGTSWNNCTATTGEGYASDSVTLTANKGRNGYSYRCKITDASGNVVYSDAAVLTVTTPEVTDPITVTTQPTDVTANKGDSVTLTVEATSNLGETLTYQWQYQTATGSKWYNCTATTGEGYASDSVTLTANKGRNGYKYRCKITDESGNVVYTDVITLTVTTN